MEIGRPIRTLLLGGVLFAALSPSAAADLAHAGYTGLISIPTHEVEPEGRASFTFSWLGGQQTYLFAPRTNRVYALTMGLLPGLEVTFRQTQVIGMYDPDAPGVEYSFDRMGSVKYQLPLPELGPMLAVGVQDVASAGALIGLWGSNQFVDQYGLRTYYAVIGDRLGPFTWNVGYGQSRAFINGAFGGLSLDLPGGLMVVTEYDSKTVNYGVRYSLQPWLSLQASRIGDETQAFGARIGLVL